MKYLFVLTIFISSILHAQSKNGEPLFPVSEDGKVGFINKDGLIIIKPVYLSAGPFSEGLAPARIDGNYGYIDAKGNFAIKPRYDFATAFNEGLAIVYIDSNPLFINKEGKQAFDFPFIAAEPFKEGKARVKTASGKTGYINKTGKLVIDTAYSSINSFHDGLAVVRILEKDSAGEIKRDDYAVIDNSGKVIVPIGRYKEINDYLNGYSIVILNGEEEESSKEGYIDKEGTLVFEMNQIENSWITGDFHCGLAKINLYKNWLPKEKGITYSSNKSYGGFINTKGEIVINDTTFKYVDDFSENRSFVFLNNKNGRRLIDRNGKFIGSTVFNNRIEKGFKNGMALVEVERKWGVIDTSGNFVIKPQYSEIDEIGFIDNYFFYKIDNTNTNSEYDELIGVASLDGSIEISPIMEDFDKQGFVNGLLHCIINGSLTYINKKGHVLWQPSKIKNNHFINLNIDRMNRGYFYAYSPPHSQDLGGYSNSINYPKQIVHTNDFDTGIKVTIRPNERDTFYKNYNGMRVYVSNRTNDSLLFNAQDSRLYMTAQALDKDGLWKNIEYAPSSWCGNSYHVLTLNPNHYWSFVMPRYEGGYKTKLRIELKYIDPNDKSENRWDKKEITMYSNEFEGSVNPGQFWRKENYYPNGLMDPYND